LALPVGRGRQVPLAHRVSREHKAFRDVQGHKDIPVLKALRGILEYVEMRGHRGNPVVRDLLVQREIPVRLARWAPLAHADREEI